MTEIRIRKHIDSETLHPPELRSLIGTDVEIIVIRESGGRRDEAATIQKTPGVCGGDACVGNTRIPVWMLVQFSRLGRADEQLLADFPSLTRVGLEAAWQYAAAHAAEVDEAIAEQELVRVTKPS